MRALMNSARAGMPRSAAPGIAASKPSGFGFSAGGEELARRPWPRPCPLWLGHGGKQHRRKCASVLWRGSEGWAASVMRITSRF